MSPHNLEEMSKAELIAELRRVEQSPSHERIVHDLEVHQIELEMQNRELRDAHEHLAEASEKYRELYDFAPVGYCTLDSEGRIVDINLRAAEMLSARRDELIGRLFATMIPREHRPAFADHLARCRGESARVTSELALDNGHVVQMVSEPILTNGGRATAFRTSFVDISALKELERDLVLLSRAGETLAASLDPASSYDTVARIAIPALADVCMLDVVTETGAVDRPVVVFADRSKTTAWADRFRALVDRPGWQTPQSRVIASGEPLLLGEVPELIRGRIGYDERDASVLRAADIRSLLIVPLIARGRVLGALTLAVVGPDRRYDKHDLELARGLASRVAMSMDNARLYQEARKASAARDATLALVAHDLRTPLQTILMRTASQTRAMAEEDMRGSSSTTLDSIHRAAQRMSRLIRDLLDVSSIEAGRFSVETTPQSLADIIAASIEALRPAAEARGLRLTGQLPEGDPLAVMCDRDRIEQVLGNLIHNAIKFTATAGAIVIRAARGDGEISVSVVDNGPGIAAAQLPHLFDRYWQAADTARLGHGLGLAIAKGIIDAHEGRIWVDSVVGVGTTFHFTLAADLSAHAPGAVASVPASDRVILVVDDDAELREVLGEQLEHAGYRVLAAGDGADALACVRRGPAPSLILLDLDMPVMDGWSLLVERERHPELSAIPVLVLSGQRDVADRLAALHVSVLVKPVAPDRLLSEVARAMQERGRVFG